MTVGYLVNPDLTSRKITFELDSASQFLGVLENDRVSVAFQDSGESFAALYSRAAKQEGAAPNPVASMGKNEAATGNARFFHRPDQRHLRSGDLCGQRGRGHR